MKKVTLYSLLFLSILSSCTSGVQMALTDAGWKTKKAYLVDNRNPLFRQQELAFGDFRTQEVKRSWTKGHQRSTGFSVGNAGIFVDHINKKQTFRFRLQQGAQASETYCATTLKTKDLVIGNGNPGFNLALDVASIGIESENLFYARITPSPEAQPWELYLDNQAAQRSKTYAGSLVQSPENYYTIVPVTKLQGKNGPIALPFGAAGFEFRNKEGQPVAAVSLIGKGMVYLNEADPAEKFLLANACAALLLQAPDL